jgi:uncharacterized protein (UPF0218 family)
MTDKRRGPDRRRLPRGGRRPEDERGYTPLVMVVDSETRRREISEAILAKLMFAVAPAESVDKAVSIVRALQPEVIIASERDAQRIRDLIPDAGIVIVPITEDTRVSDALIEAVRNSLRERPSVA